MRHIGKMRAGAKWTTWVFFTILSDEVISFQGRAVNFDKMNRDIGDVDFVISCLHRSIVGDGSSVGHMSVKTYTVLKL